MVPKGLSMKILMFMMISVFAFGCASFAERDVASEKPEQEQENRLDKKSEHFYLDRSQR
jgi:uncharacterized protein YceK